MAIVQTDTAAGRYRDMRRSNTFYLLLKVVRDECPEHCTQVDAPKCCARRTQPAGLIVKIKVIVLPETGFFVRLDPGSMILVLVREGVPEAGLRFLKDQVFLRVKGPVGHLHFLCPGIFLLRPVPENAPEPEVILVDPASFISCRLPGPEGRKLLVFGGEVQIVEKDPALFAEGFYSRKIIPSRQPFDTGAPQEMKNVQNSAACI